MRKKNLYLFTISFISGMSIMAMETTAVRLTAPFFGTSQIVWTNIIGVVLIALSAGYIIGGRLADKKPNIQTLLIPMAVAGLIYLFIPWIVEPFSEFTLSLFSGVSNGVSRVVLASFFTMTILFAAPIFLLGMVSPFVIRLLEVKDDNLGELAGIVFAVSTIGSIFGTFLPTLFFIPSVGLHQTISIFALPLLVIALLGLFSSKKLKFVAMIIPLIGVGTPTLIKSSEDIYESMYQHIEVRGERGEYQYLVFNEGFGVQSVYNKSTIFSDEYHDIYLLMAKGKNHVLVLGSAGGTIARGIHTLYNGAVKITGVEIDPVVLQIAKDRFDLPDEVNTVVADARQYIRQTFLLHDLIIVDAYQNEMYIPWTLSTQEFWQEVSKALSSDGIVALNINASSPDVELLTIMKNTIASVYPYVVLIPPDETMSMNYQIFASMQPISIPDTDVKELIDLQKYLSDSMTIVEFHEENKIFTDDWAPLEKYTNEVMRPNK